MKCRWVKETAPRGDAWYEQGQGVLIRVSKAGEPERFLRATPEQLDAVLAKGATEFFDASRPRTSPLALPSRWSSPYPRKSSRQT